jgi:hypothetical protein
MCLAQRRKALCTKWHNDHPNLLYITSLAIIFLAELLYRDYFFEKSFEVIKTMQYEGNDSTWAVSEYLTLFGYSWMLLIFILGFMIFLPMYRFFTMILCLAICDFAIGFFKMIYA